MKIHLDLAPRGRALIIIGAFSQPSPQRHTRPLAGHWHSLCGEVGGEEHIRAAYGSNLATLAAVKAIYDPDNLRCQHLQVAGNRVISPGCRGRRRTSTMRTRECDPSVILLERERIAPPQSGESREVTVGGVEFKPVLDRQRREVSVGNQITVHSRRH